MRDEVEHTRPTEGLSTVWGADEADHAAPPPVETIPRFAPGSERLVVLADPVALELAGAALEEPFERAHPGVDLVLVEASGRSPIAHVLAGNADAALVLGELSDPASRRGLAGLLLGYYVPALVRHPSNPTASLEPEQVRFLLTGQVGDWTWFGHHEGPPVLVLPSTAKSDLCGQLLIPGHVLSRTGRRLSTDAEILEEVRQIPGAVGLVATASLPNTAIAILAVSGVTPSLESYLDGSYPYGSKLHLVHRQSAREVLHRFQEFAASPEARHLLSRTLTLPR